MPRTGRRPNNPSLRVRMTLLYVGLLAALLGTLSAFIYFDLRSFLIDTTVTRIRAQAKPTVDDFLGRPEFANTEDVPVALAEDLSLALTSRYTTATVLDASGDYLADGRVLEEESSPVAPESRKVALALGGDNEVQYTESVEGFGRSLVLLIPLRNAEGVVVGVAQLNTPLSAAEAILSRERVLILAGMLAALIVGTLGGLAITRSVLSPLTGMISTCNRLAAGDLGERVNLPNRRDEIGELARAFDDMAERIQTTFESQKRFSADAAHELRTPMTAIAGSLEVLMRGSGDDPETANALIRSMHHEVTRLGKLSEQLLDLSRTENPLALEKQDISLAGFFDDFVRQAVYLAPERRLIVEEGPDTEVHADPDLLKQALLTLTDNAARHTESGGRITFGWTTRYENVELSVTDDGEGISAEDLPHVFEPFYRGDRARSRRNGGTGLGLALAQGIAGAHGGRISVASVREEGSRFVISLPRENGVKNGVRRADIF